MRDGLLLGPADLAPFGPVGTLAEQVAALLREQKGSWKLLRDGYERLSDVQTRRVTVSTLPFDVQFNPARMASSAANVEPAAIRQRRCFLCHEHLPPQQHGLGFGEFLILCNPYPIFPAHLTIAHRSHVAQRIDGAFSVLLDLCRQLGGGWDLLYNGPRCGASAPDHLHFQAGNSGSLPLLQGMSGAAAPGGQSGIASIGRPARNALTVLEGAGVDVTAVDDGLRRWFQFDGEDEALIDEAFDVLLGVLSGREAQKEHEGEEPMLNIVAVFGRQWSVLVFPRRAHRPSFYGTEGGMVISPAAVDMGGVIITPREQDFQRLTDGHIRQMFDEICLTPGDFARAAADLKRQLG